MASVTQDRLKQLVLYDKDTGIFTRIVTVSSRAKKGDIVTSKDGKGYIRFRVDGERLFAHRLAWLYVFGFMPKFIDHKNQNRSDNKIYNLYSYVIEKTKTKKLTKIGTR